MAKKYTCSLCRKTFEEDDLINFTLTPDDGYEEVTSFICFDCYAMMHSEILNHEYIEAKNGSEKANTHIAKLKGYNNELEMVFKQVKPKNQDEKLVEYKKQIKKMLFENRPDTLKRYLDKYVVGQDKAKEIMSLAVYNHYKRCLYDMEIKTGNLDVKDDDSKPDELQKSNIIVSGPSGTGKTMILRILAKKLDIPFVVVDASSLTETGYVGGDVTQCIANLINAADGNRIKAQYGIVFFDEFDKICSKNGKHGKMATINNEGLQSELLKLIEGASVDPNRNNQMRMTFPGGEALDTSNILFICGGAFDGLEEIVENRAFGSSIGFKVQDNSKEGDVKQLAGLDECEKYNTVMSKVTSDDFMQYGIMPELLGRLSTVCTLNQLSKYELYDILTKPKNAILKQYRTQYKVIDNIKIDVDDKALRAIAIKAVKNKTGARGLKTVLEQHLSDVLYSSVVKANKIDKNTKKIIIHVTADNIIKNTPPQVNIVDI